MVLPEAELLLAPWCLFILGLLVGSFLNVVIYRLPVRVQRQWVIDCADVLGVKLAPSQPATLDVTIHETGTPAPAPVQVAVPGPITLSTPRSRCPSCQHQITWYENIPVLSYVALRGKCSSCKTPISLRYPLIELATAALFAAIGWRFGAQWTTLLWCGFAATLIALAGIDWDTTYLYDDVTVPLIWAGLVAAGMSWSGVPLPQSLWGAVAGYASLFLIAKSYEVVTRSDIPAMGPGDFKLLAALGAWLGLQMLLPVVLAASLVGSVVGVYMKYGPGLREERYVPFGPFLAGGAVLVMLAGPQRVMGWLGWV